MEGSLDDAVIAEFHVVLPAGHAFDGGNIAQRGGEVAGVNGLETRAPSMRRGGDLSGDESR